MLDISNFLDNILLQEKQEDKVEEKTKDPDIKNDEEDKKDTEGTEDADTELDDEIPEEEGGNENEKELFADIDSAITDKSTTNEPTDTTDDTTDTDDPAGEDDDTTTDGDVDSEDPMTDGTDGETSDEGDGGAFAGDDETSDENSEEDSPERKLFDKTRKTHLLKAFQKLYKDLTKIPQMLNNPKNALEDITYAKLIENLNYMKKLISEWITIKFDEVTYTESLYFYNNLIKNIEKTKLVVEKLTELTDKK